MLSLQLCWRIKANLANCLQPTFSTFIRSSFPVPVVWGRHQTPHDYPNNWEDFQERVLAEVCTDTWHDYKFFILFKGNRTSSVCRQATSTATSPLQCEYLPLTTPGSASAHILGLNSWKGNLWWAGAQLQTKLEHTTGCAFYQKLFRAFSL